MPPGIDAFGVEVFHDMAEGLRGVDVVMMLRLQKERMDGGFVPSEREYFHLFGLDEGSSPTPRPDAIVMHPGPMNRGVEIDGTLGRRHQPLVIQTQVEMGVAVRMAAMDLLAQQPPRRRGAGRPSGRTTSSGGRAGFSPPSPRALRPPRITSRA
jgi:aspartate carbamoyltransferase catalytic subunit